MGSGRKGDSNRNQRGVPSHVRTRMCDARRPIQIRHANVYRKTRKAGHKRAFHPADLVFDPTLAHRGLRFGATRPLTHDPLAREAVYLSSNGRCDLPLGRAVLAAGRTPRLTWILLASSAMN